MTVGGSGDLTALARHLERLAASPSEEVYARLAGYGFSRRYVQDRDVLDIGWEEVGRGAHLLYATARSMVGVSNSAEAVSLASTLYPASNASFQEAALPHLPLPDDSFDVAIAFGVLENLEDPESLVREAKRTLKPDGIFLVSTPDKRTNSIDRNCRPLPGEMYVTELRELLERHFGNIHLYRHGAVSGGLIYPEGETSDARIEGARLYTSAPNPSQEPPPTTRVMAVCGDAVGDVGTTQPYLLLDRDRRLFEEREDLSSDVALLRDEIRLMQETEAQSSRDAHRLARINDQGYRQHIARLENQLRAIEGSRVWRSFEPYRRLRARLARQDEGGDGHGPVQK